MKKTKTKFRPLVLDRQTLTELTTSDLQQVDGGGLRCPYQSYGSGHPRCGGGGDL